jgi:hypothetical protein
MPPKRVNVAEVLGEQHHCQYDAVCDVVVEQPNYWLEDEIRAELVIYYGQLLCIIHLCLLLLVFWTNGRPNTPGNVQE